MSSNLRQQQLRLLRTLLRKVEVFSEAETKYAKDLIRTEARTSAVSAARRGWGAVTVDELVAGSESQVGRNSLPYGVRSGYEPMGQVQGEGSSGKGRGPALARARPSVVAQVTHAEFADGVSRPPAVRRSSEKIESVAAAQQRAIEERMAAASERLELALHYGTPYPRPIHQAGRHNQVRPRYLFGSEYVEMKKVSVGQGEPAADRLRASPAQGSSPDWKDDL
mmetsp:Transcript_1988/g.6279  ORF Transcript_1988/g.6279 Transcript_1988/m.6279 type:complete len:223 (-) Transcript_1988:116-784(-)